MQNIAIAKKESQRKILKTVSFKVDEIIAEKFAKLAKQKGFFQNILIQNAMLLTIEEMEKMEDKK
jgi:hypothetical protein